MAERTIGTVPPISTTSYSYPKGFTIILNDAFEASGNLKHFEVYFVKKNQVSLQVWRPQDGATSDSFKLIHQVEVDSELLEIGRQQIPISSGVIVAVQKGDRLGISVLEGTIAVGHGNSAESTYKVADFQAHKVGDTLQCREQQLGSPFFLAATYTVETASSDIMAGQTTGMLRDTDEDHCLSFKKGATVIMDVDEYKFEYDGILTSFTLNVVKSNIINLQVWRKEGDMKFTLVYDQEVDTEHLGLGRQDVPVKDGQTVQVKAGDWLGVTVQEGSMAIGYCSTDTEMAPYPTREYGTEEFAAAKDPGLPKKICLVANYTPA